MTVTGNSIIAGVEEHGTDGAFNAVDPSSGSALEPQFGMISSSQLVRAAQAAKAAFDEYRATTPKDRSAFLRRIAERIDDLGPELIERAASETGLSAGRLEGELARTVGQLRMFADVVLRGDHQRVRIDREQPDRAPTARPDIRQRHLAIGPVAVFGASNFPLAFSAAGGDTASALAAGCPVVVKAHNAHPGTAELVGHAVARAVRDSGLPGGVFSLLFGRGTTVGQQLVADPRIKAVGFTGSRAGGLALIRTAAERPEPIPVYAEMSSINPVIILPGAVADDPVPLARQFIGSLTLGSGQFCTNPGLLFVPEGAQGDAFISASADALGAVAGQTMLTSGIAQACTAGIAELQGIPGVQKVAQGIEGTTLLAPAPVLFSTSASHFATEPRLQEEVFGAAGLFVRYGNPQTLLDALRTMQGQLTATIHYAEADAEVARQLIPVLERKVGRILVGGWPTGVEVNHAMVHGGPFPATSDSRSTSVGSLAIDRFQRPVSYQNLPEELRPDAVRESNPWRLTRRIDGIIEAPKEGSRP